MKTLFLTAIITLSFSSIVSAEEVHGENCAALAESNQRTAKEVTTSKSKESTVSDAVGTVAE